ncbi:Smad nuclear interacting protein 1 [Microtus ochrogaster]|uniref:Smad nuclear interacting protein 1 n=1 Tax=Microtus ochrogaster TaxID=79684 RepID=A0A8J6L0E3_MICOH|nr:Smad nuclear interacting protein 1 [Microtus ochrogaster]
MVVKQGCLSPEPVTHLRPDVPASNPSSPGAEAGCGGHRRDRARGARRSSGEWQVSGQGRDRDSQILQAQEKERDCYNARHREHRQQNEGAGSEAQEAIPRPAGNRSKEVAVKEKPSFEFSGALLEDTNTFWDVVIKYNESPEARIPQNGGVSTPLKMMSYFRSCSSICRVLTFWVKISAPPTLHIEHPSCSKHHAVFQYWLVEYTRADGTVGRRVKPCIIDRGSGNGTFLNTKAY